MDKVHTAINRLQTAAEMSEAYYKKPLVVAISGGKDSSASVALAQMAGINFEVMHNHTTADAPETVRFVRQEFRRLELLGIKCTIDYPMYKGQRTSMWELIPQKMMPPTRIVRYCCSVLKENCGNGRFIVTGVRWAESARRKGSRGIYETNPSNAKKRIILANDNDDSRRLFETCTLKSKRTCNPIVDWTDDDVWEFIAAEQIPLNPLYACGFRRVGCIGCPMAGRKRYEEFKRWPKYQQAYIMAFDKMLERRRARGLQTEWTCGRDVFHWWMEDGVLPGQMEMEDYLDEED